MRLARRSLINQIQPELPSKKVQGYMKKNARMRGLRLLRYQAHLRCDVQGPREEVSKALQKGPVSATLEEIWINEMLAQSGILPMRETPERFRNRIKEVNRYLSDEVKDKIQLTRRDYVDRDFEKHALKHEAIIGPRRHKDLSAGLTLPEVTKRH